MTKQEQIDAAVAVIEEQARQALAKDKPYSGDGYVTAWVVASKLVDQGVITHPDLGSKGTRERERARAAVEAKAKRLLDFESAISRARILRFSPRVGETSPPRLNGMTMGFSGRAAVHYTTPELYRIASERIAAVKAKEKAEADVMAELLTLWAARGLPAPVKSNSASVTFTAEQFAVLIRDIEAVKS